MLYAKDQMMKIISILCVIIYLEAFARFWMLFKRCFFSKLSGLTSLEWMSLFGFSMQIWKDIHLTPKLFFIWYSFQLWESILKQRWHVSIQLIDKHSFHNKVSSTLIAGCKRSLCTFDFRRANGRWRSVIVWSITFSIGPTLMNGCRKLFKIQFEFNHF